MSAQQENKGTGLQPNVAGILCYLFWLVSGIVFFVIEKDKFVRFHAVQSIGFSIFAIILWIIAIVLAFIPILGWIIDFIIYVGIVVIWIILMVKAYQGKMVKLPVIGNFAEKYSNPPAK